MRDVTELIIQPRAIDRASQPTSSAKRAGFVSELRNYLPHIGRRAHKRNLSRLTSLFLLFSLYVDVTKGRAIPRDTRDYIGRTCLARRKRAFCPRRN